MKQLRKSKAGFVTYFYQHEKCEKRKSSQSRKMVGDDDEGVMR